MNATVLSLVMATVFAPPAKTSAERSTRIYVRTTPPGASIVLDGKELGTSDGLFLVPPGVRKITLEMDGYDPETKSLDVKDGWITRVEVQMVKKGREAGDTTQGPVGPDLPTTQLQKAKEASDGKFDVPFEDEFELAVRAGQDKLTDQEKESLKQQNHPLLGQLADPNTSKLIRFFAKLPDEIHEQLKKAGHVKWRFPDLSEENQKVVHDIIWLNTNMAKQQGTSQPGLSLEALQDSEVGFAVVAMEGASQKVVSWFVLFPEFPNPIWVTVVNAKAAGTPPYFQAHLRNLSLLREKPETAPPEEARAEVRKIHLPDADTKDTPVVLDLASGDMLNPPPSHGAAAMDHFTKLGKGDIGVDHGLFCLRGGKIEEVKEGAVRPHEVDGQMGDASLYLLPELPCELLVTTAEKRQYLVRVLEETDEGGLRIEYQEQSEAQVESDAAESASTDATTPVRKGVDADTRMKLQEAKAQVALLDTAMERYRLDLDEYPKLLEWLIQQPIGVENSDRWNGPYLKTPNGAIPVDPWGNAYKCIRGGAGPDRYLGIGSRGPDGQFETPDDVVTFDPADSGLPTPVSDRAQSTDVRWEKPPEGILEFRIAANKEEAKSFSEDGTDLGWYDSVMDNTDNLVTREHGRRTQVLLWQTPEKSMTRNDGEKKKWRVIEVSVIAEPDKPGRIGVVFDEEGGRQLKKLTAGNVNRHMAMLVDGRVVSCPMIRSAIGPRVEITGNFSKAELNRLATALQAGMEPSRP